MLFEAKPQQNVRLVVLRADGKPVLSMGTDANGAVTLPKFAPGQYCIDGAPSPTLRDTLCLAVSNRKADKPSEFFLELRERPPLPKGSELTISNAKNLQPSEYLPTFAGNVKDPSGAGITGTSIEIYRHGHEEHGKPKKVKADKRGHFSADLHGGVYTIVFPFKLGQRAKI